jgi:hypothetical protein
VTIRHFGHPARRDYPTYAILNLWPRDITAPAQQNFYAKFETSIIHLLLMALRHCSSAVVHTHLMP